MRNPKTLLKLFSTFFKIGAFTFGGGYAMIPLIQREAVEKQGWISDDDILEIVAIAESTPGPIAVNAATFIGYRTAGVVGAFFATLGVVLPSFLIIALLSRVIEEFQHIRAVKYAFFGIRAGVLAMILKALCNMFKKCKKNALSLSLMALAFVLVALLNLKVLHVIFISAAIGLVFSLMAERRAGK